MCTAYESYVHDRLCSFFYLSTVFSTDSFCDIEFNVYFTVAWKFNYRLDSIGKISVVCASIAKQSNEKRRREKRLAWAKAKKETKQHKLKHRIYIWSSWLLLLNESIQCLFVPLKLGPQWIKFKVYTRTHCCIAAIGSMCCTQCAPFSSSSTSNRTEQNERVFHSSFDVDKYSSLPCILLLAAKFSFEIPNEDFIYSIAVRVHRTI